MSSCVSTISTSLTKTYRTALTTKSTTIETKVELKTCYLNLGLDIGRGENLKAEIKAYLNIPGNSIRLNNSLMDESKLKIVKVAHHLLYEENWGMEIFTRPARKLDGCKRLKFGYDSTEYVLPLPFHFPRILSFYLDLLYYITTISFFSSPSSFIFFLSFLFG